MAEIVAPDAAKYAASSSERTCPIRRYGSRNGSTTTTATPAASAKPGQHAPRAGRAHQWGGRARSPPAATVVNTSE